MRRSAKQVLFRTLGAAFGPSRNLVQAGLICALALLALPGTAFADAVFSVSSGYGGSQSDPAGASVSGIALGGAIQDGALANAGGLGAFARVSWDVARPAGLGAYSRSTWATASWFFDDLIITGAGSSPTGSLNLTLNGVFGANIFNLSNLFTAGLTSSVGFSLTGNVAGQGFAGSFNQTHTMSVGGLASGDCNPCESTTVTTSGIIGQGPLPVNLTTQVFNLPVNTPFSMALQLNSNAYLSWAVFGSSCDDSGCSSAFNIDSLSDFSHTLSFPTSGPVFNLSDGFTLNSAQANIVNNHIPAESVPEPGTLPLLAFGLPALAAIRKKLRALFQRA